MKTYEWREILEAVGICSIWAERGLILQDERDLNDPHGTCGHQGISEDGVDHGTQHQLLRVCGHGITGQQDDNGRDQIALRPAVPLPAEPDTQQTGAPPDNTHRGVLEVTVHPWASPAVFGEGVDASPSSDDQRVKELLASTSAAQPVLTDEQQDSQKDTVGDECAAHNEVRQTLSQMVFPTETQGRDATENHLHPADNWHHLPHHSVCDHNIPTDPSMNALGEMQLEVCAQNDLENEH